MLAVDGMKMVVSQLLHVVDKSTEIRRNLTK